MWRFWIDVGGTFTDCVARSPDGDLKTFKTLSTGVVKGSMSRKIDSASFCDHARQADPQNFWTGSTLRFVDAHGQVTFTSGVSAFDASSGTLTLVDRLPAETSTGTNYELVCGDDAPILAIRHLLGLSPGEPIPHCEVRLGTTRGTNALLERKGATTLLVTTRGFADILLIANQDRPRLFDLTIQKPKPLFSDVLEIDERLTPAGDVVKAIEPAEVRRQLMAIPDKSVSLAICLLHAFANPGHEEQVERIAREVGFTEISRSSSLAPLIKIVSRGDTTVMDAYLNPVLKSYLRRIRSSLEQSSDSKTGLRNISTLKLMTSAGGLVDSHCFVGKDSILSGPAGGVIGFSKVSSQAGFPRSIGFDMGGTSTDVSRFDGNFDLEFETRKAGVRIVAPMLAIETVAAGGGSICRFDGVKLVVGPESAGADPGPACYGRGGPITVTDVNLVLGRILPARFPFPLDRHIVVHKLQMICDEIRASSGTKYTVEELAQGFIEIANANMVRAISRVSVARGYDPADYVLTTFGGAGGMHACAIARELGMKRILLHPLAGLLSAYGMGAADIRRFSEHSVLKPLSPVTLAELQPVFTDMEQKLRKEVLGEGISEENILPGVRSLDLRYRGLEAAINVVEPAEGDFQRLYEETHEQRFGYRLAGREVEIVAARLEVIGRTPDHSLPTSAVQHRIPVPPVTTEVWETGQKNDVGVFLREDLQAGDEINGPAIVCEPTSTIFIASGFRAQVRERGELLLQDTTPLNARQNAEPSADELTQTADPVQLEIFNNQFASIAEQMGVMLQKTALSTNVKERLDFSCALFDSLGNLVVNAPHIPVHLGAMSETVQKLLEDFPDMTPGDVYVTNDPYRGGSHLPDVTVVTPVHDRESRKLLFLVASRAHHAEIGGIVPGSMPPFSRNLGEEGILIRARKLVDAGTSREDELRQLLLSGQFPTRNVEDNLADLRAQVAANQTGVGLLLDLVNRKSLPLVREYMTFIQQAASRKMRLALTALPDGTYSCLDHLDNGAPVSVTIKKTGERATVDFTGTGPVLETNLNANRAIVSAAVLYVFRCLINEDIPLNSGVLEPVEIILPECLLNPSPASEPEKSPAMVGGNVETSQRVVDVLLGALNLAAASQGTMNNLTFGDQSFGYYETICGGSGATPQGPGADAVHTHMTNTRLTDVEVIERRYPVRVRQFSIRRGSGGGGEHRGGDGIIREIEFLRPLTVSCLSQRRGPDAPFGLNGGGEGLLGRNRLRRTGSDEWTDLGGSFQIEVQPGDLLRIESPGGGGWGKCKSQVLGTEADQSTT